MSQILHLALLNAVETPDDARLSWDVGQKTRMSPVAHGSSVLSLSVVLGTVVAVAIAHRIGRLRQRPYETPMDSLAL